MVLFGTSSKGRETTGYAGSLEKRSRSSQEIDEKAKGEDLTEANVIDAGDGDEALLLVGAERTTEFSEEYYANLRRKLVRNQQYFI